MYFDEIRRVCDLSENVECYYPTPGKKGKVHNFEKKVPENENCEGNCWKSDEINWKKIGFFSWSFSCFFLLLFAQLTPSPIGEKLFFFQLSDDCMTYEINNFYPLISVAVTTLAYFDSDPVPTVPAYPCQGVAEYSFIRSYIRCDQYYQVNVKCLNESFSFLISPTH